MGNVWGEKAVGEGLEILIKVMVCALGTRRERL